MARLIIVISALVVATILAASEVDGTKYSVCDQDKTTGDVSNVVISDCETLQQPCPFVRGFNKSIELDFTPKQKSDLVKVKLAGKIKKLPVPFHINPDVACGNYGLECPIEPNKPYKLKMTMPIYRTYPKIDVDVFLRLVDEKDNTIICVEMPAKIQEPVV